MESLYQKPKQGVREFALQVEDCLTEYVASGDAALTVLQRAALTADIETQALVVFVDLRKYSYLDKPTCKHTVFLVLKRD